MALILKKSSLLQSTGLKEKIVKPIEEGVDVVVVKDQNNSGGFWGLLDSIGNTVGNTIGQALQARSNNFLESIKGVKKSTVENTPDSRANPFYDPEIEKPTQSEKNNYGTLAIIGGVILLLTIILVKK